MENLSLIHIFTNDDEKILNDYEIISKDSKDYEKGVKDYPEIANQEVYKLKAVSYTHLQKSCKLQ